MNCDEGRTVKLKRGSILGVSALAMILSGCAQTSPAETPERNDSGAIIAPVANADVLKLTVGDCAKLGPGANRVTAVSVTPCDDPHSAEVFASFNTAEAKRYPGSSTLVKDANATCKNEFERFVGLPYDESKLDYWPIFPSSESWAAGDRATLCLVSQPGKEVAGSFSGSKM